MTSTYVNISTESSYWIKEPFPVLISMLIWRFIPSDYNSDISEWEMDLNEHCRAWKSNDSPVNFSPFSKRDFNQIILAMAKGYEFLGSIIGNEQAEEEFVEGQIGTGQPVKNLRFYLGEIIELAKQDPRFDKTFFESSINLDNKS